MYINVENLALLVLLPIANQFLQVAQYNCLEFNNFTRIWPLKLLLFWCKKKSLLFSFQLLLEVLYM